MSERLSGLRQAHRVARAVARARLSPGRFRARSEQLHERSGDLRPADPHAALVVRRALHPPADPPVDGALADFRSDVPGQPVPRLSRQLEHARREHARHRARARPRRFREEQPPLRALRRDVRHEHRRARRGAGAPHRRGGEESRPAARRSDARRGARARAARRLEPGAAPAALSEVRRSGRAGRCADDPFGDRFRNLPGEGGPPEQSHERTRARRSRRTRNRTCCGSSRTTAPSSKTGSATSSSRCATSRSISIRSSRATS